MSDANGRHHGLEAFLGEPNSSAGDSAAITVLVQGELEHGNLRGNPEDAQFVQAAEQLIGQPLPVVPNTFTAGEHRVFWLGPDEWLVCMASGRVATLGERFDATAADTGAVFNDVSGGYVAMRIEGEASRRLLAKGCTLDLHPHEFEVGRCAQSGLAKAAVLLALESDSPAFFLLVRRSFADYLCRWLAHSGREFGIRFIRD